MPLAIPAEEVGAGADAGDGAAASVVDGQLLERGPG
jgi:hypothetical protein